MSLLGGTARFLDLPDSRSVEIAWGSLGVTAIADRHLGLRRQATGRVLGRINFHSSALNELSRPEGAENCDAGTVRAWLVSATPAGKTYKVLFFGEQLVQIDIADHSVDVAYDPKADVELLVDDVLQMALSEFIRPHGGMLFHASSVSHAGRGLMLVSKSGTGKSSSCLACVIAGAGLLGDDATLVVPSGAGAAHIVPLAAELSVRLRCLNMYPDSRRLDLRRLPQRHFWRTSAPVPEAVPLRVVAALTTSGEAGTTVRPISPAEFITRCSTPPPLQGLERGGFTDCVTRLAASGVRFVVAEVGLAPETVSGALLECLADETQPAWEVSSPLQMATVAQAQRQIARLWEKREQVTDVLPLLAHPVPSVAKAALVALAVAPGARIEPIPWDDYDDLEASPWTWTDNRWQGFASWHAGAVALAERLDPRFLAAEIDEWLRHMPILYPFMRSGALSNEARTVLDESWRRLLSRRYPRELMLHLTDAFQLRSRHTHAGRHMLPPRPPMSREFFGQVLEWAAAQGVKMVSLTGGEPTMHPSFSQLIRMIPERGMAFHLATSLLASDADRNPLQNAATVEVYIGDPDDYSPTELRRFEENTRWLCVQPPTRFFNYHLWRHDEANWRWVLDTVTQSAATELLYTLPCSFPSETSGDHLGKDLSRRGEMVASFVRQCSEYGIRVAPARPLPLCMFAESELTCLLERSAVTTASGIATTGRTRNLVIDSARNVHPYITISGSPVAFRSQPLAELSFELEKHILCRYLRPAHDKCQQCPLWQSHLCGAGCLGYAEASPRGSCSP